MPIPPGYSAITVEQIVRTSGDHEKLKLDFVGGDGEKIYRETNSMKLFYGVRTTLNLLETQLLMWIPFLRWARLMMMALMIVILLRSLPQHCLFLGKEPGVLQLQHWKKERKRPMTDWAHKQE